MKKWFSEEFEFEVEVVGFLRGQSTEWLCRNGEEVGECYKCTYGCPTNADGQGICSKMMLLLFPAMEAVRSGGTLQRVGGSAKLVKEIVCPDGCVIFRLKARKIGAQNFFALYNAHQHKQELLANAAKLHTTALGAKRIAANLGILSDAALAHCKKLLLSEACQVSRRGKNYYGECGGVKMTINSASFAIITARLVGAKGA